MEISCADQLPEYMKMLYMEVLHLYNEVEEEMAKEGMPYATHYAKEEVRNFFAISLAFIFAWYTMTKIY